MTTTETSPLPTLLLDPTAEAIGWPADQWAGNCHAVSLAIVRAGLLDDYGPRPRVARGTHLEWCGQHSWIVLGDDVYDDDAVIVDPTLWTFSKVAPRGIYIGRYGTKRDDGVRWHMAKGHGPRFIEAGPPGLAVPSSEPAIELRGRDALSSFAQTCLDMIESANGGRITRRTWMDIGDGYTMVGWPAGEIIGAMLDTPELASFVAVDIAGMLTDRNPQGLYLAERHTDD